MIILHPSWLARGERRYEGDHQRVTDRVRPDAAGGRITEIGYQGSERLIPDG